jgi:hypothetical protein
LLVSFLNDSEGAASEPDAIGGEVCCGRAGAEKVFGDEQRFNLNFRDFGCKFFYLP